MWTGVVELGTNQHHTASQTLNWMQSYLTFTSQMYQNLSNWSAFKCLWYVEVYFEVMVIERQFRIGNFAQFLKSLILNRHRLRNKCHKDLGTVFKDIYSLKRWKFKEWNLNVETDDMPNSPNRPESSADHYITRLRTRIAVSYPFCSPTN